MRIHSIVASECAGSLPPLPIVPYAIALSMGVSYRQLRSSKLITHFDRAKASLEACCTLLEDLSPQWYSAEAMARLGQKALQQIDHEHQRHPGSEFLIPQATTSTDLAASMPSEVSHAKEETTLGTTGVDSTRPPMASALEVRMDSPLLSSELDTTLHGFADIDTLFGEFLDLSLPTNFWDPIFAEEESAVHNHDVV